MSRPSRSVLFRSILCPVDFSPRSTAALKTATAIALRCGAHLTTLWVDDPLLGAGAASVGYDTRRLRELTIAQLDRLLRRVALPLGLPRERVSSQVVLGPPAAGILTIAKKLNADLIVMGTNGRQGASRLLFGSTAERVLRQTSVPVMVVPRGRPRWTSASRFGRRLLVALELDAEATSDVRRAREVARALDAKVTLTHVVPVTSGPPWLEPQLQTAERHRLTAARSRLAALAGRAVGVRTDMRVALGHPAEEIAAAAHDVGADLIVLALRRGRGLFGRRQGTTTYRVLCGTTIPVLALPATH